MNYVFYDTAKQAGFEDVEKEPELQPLSGESFKYKSANTDEEARSDLRILGFWSRQRREFFDVFFAVRPKLQEQEPFKLLHDAREEEEARVSGTHPQR